jgi:hypothetical protein
MNTLNHAIDCFELPLPAIETYRVVTRYRSVPMQSLDLEVEFDEEAPPPSDRFSRARCWSSED